MIYSRQLQIYETIACFLAVDHPPTRRDLLAACHISSTSVLCYHLDRLWLRGLVTWKRYESRSLRLAHEPQPAPLLERWWQRKGRKPRRPKLKAKRHGNLQALPPQSVLDTWRGWGWTPAGMGAVVEKLNLDIGPEA